MLDPLIDAVYGGSDGPRLEMHFCVLELEVTPWAHSFTPWLTILASLVLSRILATRSGGTV